VVPPCTISEAEAKEGLAALDEALGEIAGYYEG
jgi:4-aminobutyrate aminotransferase-like enzyme